MQTIEQETATAAYNKPFPVFKVYLNTKVSGKPVREELSSTQIEALAVLVARRFADNILSELMGESDSITILREGDTL